MIISDTPFYAESLVDTYGEIMDHKQSLNFPLDIEISENTMSSIRANLTNRQARLDYNGINKIKHSILQNSAWIFYNIRDLMPHIGPELNSDNDTLNFDEIEHICWQSFAIHLFHIYLGTISCYQMISLNQIRLSNTQSSSTAIELP